MSPKSNKAPKKQLTNNEKSPQFAIFSFLPFLCAIFWNVRVEWSATTN
jgi:hypothetical protein